MPEGIRDKVAIIGASCTKFGDNFDQSYDDMVVEAAFGAFADAGGPVIGSCNGFQILCEAGMLPGVLMRNDHLQFRCDWQWLRVERPIGPWLAADELAPGDVVRMPISHGEGRYYADDETLDSLEREGRVVLRYAEASGAVTRNFGSRYRYTGAALTTDLAWLIGAAFAPLVALALAAHFGLPYVGLYLLSGALATLAALGVNRWLKQRESAKA